MEILDYHLVETLTLLVATVSAAMSAHNARKIQEVHLSINSRMDQLLVSEFSKGENAEKDKTNEAFRIKTEEERTRGI